jgi:hypothetical protein
MGLGDFAPVRSILLTFRLTDFVIDLARVLCGAASLQSTGMLQGCWQPPNHSRPLRPKELKAL